ncbi:hypothetical protein BH10PLA2_BH10PLA2_08620 [soil metagenome]
MRSRPSLLLLLAFGLAPISFTTSGCRPVPAPETAVVERTDVDGLLRLIEQRLALMDDVARWKWNESQPVTDPKREQELLEKVVERGQGRGLDPELVRSFFAAQMEAARSIQQADFERWTAQKQKPFADATSLTGLRQRIDAINDQLIDALVQVTPRLKTASMQQELRRRSQEILKAPGMAEVRDKVIAPLMK